MNALQHALGTNEYHFAEIFSSRDPPFGVLNLEQRLMIFEMFANIIYVHEVSVYVQTFDPDSHEMVMRNHPVGVPKKSSIFDLRRHSDLALWHLLNRVQDHILERQLSTEQRGMVFIDEGMKRAGTSVDLGPGADIVVNGKLLFASSTTTPMLQLADVAAFATNRSQLVIRKEKRSDSDIALLETLSLISPQFIDCRKVTGWFTNEGPLL